MNHFLRCSRRYSALSRLVGNVRATGENITGHTEVLLAQKQVKEHKDALKVWRKELASATQSYEEVQQQLKRLYARKTHVYQDQRRDLAILQAINNEEESLLFEEQQCASRMEECKQRERETFEALSDAIQDSHEKERAQSERMKYYTRIGSLLGAFFGFLGSNFFIRREIRQYNSQQSQRFSRIEELLILEEAQHEYPTSAEAIDSTQQQIASINQSVSDVSEKMNVLKHHLEKEHQLPEDSCVASDVTSTIQIAPSDDIVLGSVVSYSLILTFLALL